MLYILYQLCSQCSTNYKSSCRISSNKFIYAKDPDFICKCKKKNTTTVVDLKSLMEDGVNFVKMKWTLFVAELLSSRLSMQKTPIAFVNVRKKKTTTLAELKSLMEDGVM